MSGTIGNHISLALLNIKLKSDWLLCYCIWNITIALCTALCQIYHEGEQGGSPIFKDFIPPKKKKNNEMLFCFIINLSGVTYIFKLCYHSVYGTFKRQKILKLILPCQYVIPVLYCICFEETLSDKPQCVQYRYTQYRTEITITHRTLLEYQVERICISGCQVVK